MERRREDGYWVSDDRALIDRAWVANWLATESYWAIGRPRSVQDAAIEASLCIGLYAPDGSPAGFCRFVTDAATFAWLCDVFVADEHRGSGLGIFMVGSAIEHPAVATVKRQVLITASAHDLYAKFGYVTMTAEEQPRWMVRLSPAPS